MKFALKCVFELLDSVITSAIVTGTIFLNIIPKLYQLISSVHIEHNLPLVDDPNGSEPLVNYHISQVTRMQFFT